MYKGLPPPTPLGGECAEGRKPLPSPCNTQAWCYGLWGGGGFHWSMYLRGKRPSFSTCHMLYVHYKKGGPLAQEQYAGRYGSARDVLKDLPRAMSAISHVPCPLC